MSFPCSVNTVVRQDTICWQVVCRDKRMILAECATMEDACRIRDNFNHWWFESLNA